MKAPTPKVTEFQLPLDEFCTRLSATDKRVEMISGFHSFMKRGGQTVATQTVFEAAFRDFATRPM